MVFPGVAAVDLHLLAVDGDYIAVTIVGGKTQMLGNIIYGQLVTAKQPAAGGPVTSAGRHHRLPVACGAPAHWRTSDAVLDVDAPAGAGLDRALVLVFPLRPAASGGGAQRLQHLQDVRLSPTGFTWKWWADAGPAPGCGGPWSTRWSWVCARRRSRWFGTMAAFAVQRYRFSSAGRPSFHGFLITLPASSPASPSTPPSPRRWGHLGSGDGDRRPRHPARDRVQQHQASCACWAGTSADLAPTCSVSWALSLA